MRRFLSAAVLAAALGCAGTGAQPVDEQSDDQQVNSLTSLPTEVTLRYGEERRVGEVLRLGFEEVLGDSRCPIDVICVWAGNVEVRIGISLGMGPTFPLELSSLLEPRSVDWKGIRVTLLEVTPQPKSEQTIPPEAYTIRLLVEKVR